jgi:hypothetical protein
MSVLLLATVVVARSVREGLLSIWSRGIRSRLQQEGGMRSIALHWRSIVECAIIFSILPGRSSRDVVADQSYQTYKSCNQKLKLRYSKSFKKL